MDATDAEAVTQPPDFAALACRFDAPGVHAIVLMGSFARGDAGLYSDIDLLRFSAGDATLEPADGSYLEGGWLLNVSTMMPGQVEEWFSQPNQALRWVAGLRSAHCLVDREGTFAAIQARAAAFHWDAGMQEKADGWASRELAGWAEEAHKGLEGLRQNDVGRLLNARFGCSWGLTRVMSAHLGVLVTGDNSFFDELRRAPGLPCEWVELQRAAFGIEAEGAAAAPTLRDQVIAGLQLYVLTARLLSHALRPEDAAVIHHTVELIEREFTG